MFAAKGTSASSSQYAPLARHDDGERSSSTLTLKRSSSSSAEDDEKQHHHHHHAGASAMKAVDDDDDDDDLSPSAAPLALPRLILYFSLALALLSAVNIALLPSTLAKYHAYPFSDAEAQALPHGDFRLGLDRAAKNMPRPGVFGRAWPDKMARVSRKLKNTVYGEGAQVYITVEDSTIIRFPVPQDGAKTCAISWTPPPERSARAKDLTVKGDITEIEVWHLIASSAKSTKAAQVPVEQLDYDTLSYGRLPVRGELLGTLDLTATPNSTTVEFACPSGTDSLVVEMTCQRVACHVSYLQVDVVPRFGMELVRRKE